jgi:hypothetical protein
VAIQLVVVLVKPCMDEFMKEHVRQKTRSAVLTREKADSPVHVISGGDHLAL